MKCNCGMCKPRLPVLGKEGKRAYPGPVERSLSVQGWLPLTFRKSRG